MSSSVLALKGLGVLDWIRCDVDLKREKETRLRPIRLSRTVVEGDKGEAATTKRTGGAEGKK